MCAASGSLEDGTFSAKAGVNSFCSVGECGPEQFLFAVEQSFVACVLHQLVGGDCYTEVIAHFLYAFFVFYAVQNAIQQRPPNINMGLIFNVV